MSADAGGVRLWHNYYAPTSYHSYVTDEGAVLAWERADPYIAYPAAQAKAMLAALEDAQAYIDSGVVDVARAVGISNRITAALSTLPRAEGRG